MSHTNLILFILIAMLCSTITSIILTEKDFRCGKHEVWRRCGKCPRTCYSPNLPCIRDCFGECRCRKKYVRGPSGQCIRPSQCDPNSPNYSPDF